MKSNSKKSAILKMTNYRWLICAMLFFATTVNYMDRQVLSLTWKDFIAPEFHWTDSDYGTIAGIFGIVYAIAGLFAGKFIDWLGTKKGYIWAIFIWSLGACLHAFCGWATEQVVGVQNMANMLSATGAIASTIAITSVYFFIAARIILGIGEAGNFPAAIKVTAEYFPKKDRAFATSIFNAGATIGALIAPLSIPSLARYFKNIGVGNGWEMAFIVIGFLGFIWMGLWMFVYKKPKDNKFVNDLEREYIEQDQLQEREEEKAQLSNDKEKAIPLSKVLQYKQTWAIILGKFITDGAWWFFLFWTPAYISDVYGLSSDNPMAQLLIFVLYAITMLSILGGKLPTIIINKTGKDPYTSRMKAMLIFAIFPLLTLLAQPLGRFSYWFPIIIIGITGAAHQSWSANLYSVISDMFPKSTIGTLTGLNGMAGGFSAFFINIGSGHLFNYAKEVNMHFFGFEGIEAGYFIVFCFCAISYIIGWCIIKILVPKYKLVQP